MKKLFVLVCLAFVVGCGSGDASIPSSYTNSEQPATPPDLTSGAGGAEPAAPPDMKL